MAKVIFNVGALHPLYNKIVEANIITRSGGYDKRTIEAETIEEVHYPSDPKGKFVFNEYGDIIGFQERAAYSEKWKGWVKEIVEEDVKTNFNAEIYDFNSGKLIAESLGESHPYFKGEAFQPIEDMACRVVCASMVRNNKQIVFCVRTDLD